MLLADLGAKLVGVLDHSGAVGNERGIDAHALAAHVERNGAVAGFKGAPTIDKEAFYDMPSDLFIPAALEKMITVPIAERLRTRVVVEAANGPTEASAEPILLKRGIEVLPAILCNAGGVTVSYFEWVQNKNNESWSLQDVDARLLRYTREMCDRVRQTRKQYDCDMRMAAYITALKRIATVYDQRGIFP
jgi:glutamate dehydrogenase (NAD(P)+)